MVTGNTCCGWGFEHITCWFSSSVNQDKTGDLIQCYLKSIELLLFLLVLLRLLTMPAVVGVLNTSPPGSTSSVTRLEI